MKEKKRFIGIVIAVFIVGIVIGVICVSGYQTLEKKKEEQKKEAKKAEAKKAKKKQIIRCRNA